MRHAAAGLHAGHSCISLHRSERHLRRRCTLSSRWKWSSAWSAATWMAVRSVEGVDWIAESVAAVMHQLCYRSIQCRWLIGAERERGHATMLKSLMLLFSITITIHRTVKRRTRWRGNRDRSIHTRGPHPHAAARRQSHAGSSPIVYLAAPVSACLLATIGDIQTQRREGRHLSDRQ